MIDLLQSRSCGSMEFDAALRNLRGYDTLLTSAIACKSIKMVRKLINMNFDVDQVVSGCTSPLSVALWGGDLEIIEYLLTVARARSIPGHATIFGLLNSQTLLSLPRVSRMFLNHHFGQLLGKNVT